MTTAKQKLKKVNVNSNDSADEDSEHELFYYANDRIKLMKEVLKLIKAKKIKAIAPDFMKNWDIDEINSILLEELLGISNKRLRHILNGDHIDTVSTSSDSEEEQKPVDIISLDDISDSDDEFGLGSINVYNDKDKKKTNFKGKNKEIKKEKGEDSKIKQTHSEEKVKESENDKLMNVLEILELQARARAIRSQLALENMHKKTKQVHTPALMEDEDDTAVIMSIPGSEEIIITSSESEDDTNKRKGKSNKKRNVTSTSTDNCLNNIGNTVSSTENDTPCDFEQLSTNDTNIEYTSKEVEQPSTSKDQELILIGITPNDVKSSNLNISEDINRDSSDDKNQIPYKSDSDNDVINLDSEDLENV